MPQSMSVSYTHLDVYKRQALALRARLWVYAASPLFNGGYKEALSLTNHDGKRLFPDRHDNKWQTA